MNKQRLCMCAVKELEDPYLVYCIYMLSFLLAPSSFIFFYFPIVWITVLRPICVQFVDEVRIQLRFSLKTWYRSDFNDSVVYQ